MPPHYRAAPSNSKGQMEYCLSLNNMGIFYAKWQKQTVVTSSTHAEMLLAEIGRPSPLGYNNSYLLVSQTLYHSVVQSRSIGSGLFYAATYLSLAYVCIDLHLTA